MTDIDLTKSADGHRTPRGLEARDYAEAKERVDLTKDEPALRLAVAKVLEPGPWKHKWELRAGEDFEDPATHWKCTNCGRTDTGIIEPDGVGCIVPDLPTESLEVLVGQMLRKCDLMSVVCSVHRFKRTLAIDSGDDDLGWFVFEATPAEQLVVLLEAVTGEKDGERCSLCRGTGIAPGTHNVSDLYEEPEGQEGQQP